MTTRLRFVLAFSFLLLMAVRGKAQAPSVLWNKAFGGDDFDMLYKTLPTADGGYLLAGTSLSGVTGDKTEPTRSANTGDYWIVKVDAAGNKLWDKTFGGNAGDFLATMIATPDGGYLLGGSSHSGISGEKTEGARGMDYWVVKIDAQGNKLWDKTIGGTGTDELFTLFATADGGYLLGGLSYSNIGGDKTEFNISGRDYWLVKVNGTGVKQWDKTYGGNGEDVLTCILATGDGGYYIGGQSSSPISGNKTLPSKGSYDYWILKVDAAGVKQWEKTFGGDNADNLVKMIPLADGGFMLAGESLSGPNGDKTSFHKGFFDYWILKVNSNWQHVWDRTFGGFMGEDYLKDCEVTSDGGFLLGGFSRSGINEDKSTANLGWEDFWVIKTDATGLKQWDKTIGGNDEDFLYSITPMPDGAYLLSGYSYTNVNGDKTVPTRGGRDYWILKLGYPATVATGSLASATLCASGQVSVPYTATGAFAGGNVFTVQLSDASGSFASPVAIGTLASTALSGSITATIPADVAAGTGYRIRVVSSSPVAIGANNGVNLSVFRLPAANAGTAQTICAGVSAAIGAPAVAGNTYSWVSNPAGFTSTVSNPTVSPLVTTIYTLTETISGSGCAKSGTVTITVNPLPATPTITAPASTSACQGNSITLTSSATSGNQWFKDGTIINGATGVSYQATASGIYAVTASSSGCTSLASSGVTVTINPIPTTPSITAGGPVTFCQGGNVVLTSSAASGTQWFRDGVAQATGLTYTANQSGVYTAVVTQNGCASAASAAVTVTVNPLPAIPVITANGGVLSSSASTGNQWYQNGSLITGATAQTYTATASADYTVQVTQNGCSSTSAVFVMVFTSIGGPSVWNGEVAAYPNPVQQTLYVRNGAMRSLEWRMVDAVGRQVASGKLGTSNGAIDMKALSPGLYHLLLTDVRKRETVSIVVVRN